MIETQRLPAIHVDRIEIDTRVATPVLKSFSWKYVVLVLFVAYLVNAATVLVVLPTMSRTLPLSYSTNFGDLYELIAKNLDEGNGYRVDATTSKTMLREPGYPLLLAAVFHLGGYGIQQARVLCVLLCFGAASMLLLLTRNITGDAPTALLAAVLFLIYPGTLIAETRAGVEMPCIFSLILFMLALYSAYERGSSWRYCLAGLTFGVSVLVRSEILLFLFPLAICLFLVAKGWTERRKVLENCLALALGTVIVMLPWILRNYALVHQFVPTATVAGVAAQEGLYSCENVSPAEPFVLAQTRAGFEREDLARQLGIPFIGPYYQLFYTAQDELAFNRALLSHVATEYRKSSRLLVGCATKNLFFNFWFLGKTPKSVMLNVLVQVPLLVLAAAGVEVLRKRGLLRKAGILLLYILYVPAVHALIIAHARHSILVVPFLASLAAAFVVSALRALKIQYSHTPSLEQSMARLTGSEPSKVGPGS